MCNRAALLMPHFTLADLSDESTQKMVRKRKKDRRKMEEQKRETKSEKR